MRVLHILDNSNIGGIQELILRFHRRSRHQHEFLAADGSMASIIRGEGMQLWNNDIQDYSPYNVVFGHGVGGWSYDNTFNWMHSMGIKTVEIMHSNAPSQTTPSSCDAFVSVNKIAAEINKHMPKSQTIYSYFETDLFKPTEHGPFIGRLSRLADEKRPQAFMALAMAFPTEKFLMAGDGQLMEHLKAHRPYNVEMLGWVRDFPNFYNKLKLFVFPTRDECCCYAVAYAQAAGVPIICQDIPALRESTGGFAWYARGLDDFEAKIKQFLAEPESYKFVEPALKWATETFNDMEQWDTLINEVCK